METHIDTRRLLMVLEGLKGGSGTFKTILDAYMCMYPPSRDESRREVRAWRGIHIRAKLKIFYDSGLVGKARVYDDVTSSLKNHLQITATGRHFLHIE